MAGRGVCQNATLQKATTKKHTPTFTPAKRKEEKTHNPKTYQQKAPIQTLTNLLWTLIIYIFTSKQGNVQGYGRIFKSPIEKIMVISNTFSHWCVLATWPASRLVFPNPTAILGPKIYLLVLNIFGFQLRKEKKKLRTRNCIRLVGRSVRINA